MSTPDRVDANAPAHSSAKSADMGKAFEKMLWSEMLSHAGFEKAVTMNGGEGVSAFARMMVEAIAEDISEKHPLGLGQSALTSEVSGQGESA